MAPPIGAFLFAAGMALPFIVDAAGFLLGAVLVSRVVYSVVVDAPAVVERATGATRWPRACAGCWDHPPMRTLVITIFAFNITFGAAWSVLVLYAQERLGMTAVGFGLITTAMAIGGIVGTVSYGRLERRFSLADIMRVGLVIETGTHLVARADDAAGRRPRHVHGLRRARVRVGDDRHRHPAAGRPGCPPRAGHGRLPRGRHGGDRRRHADRGAARRAQYGITAPFWFGFAGSAILVVLLWREFDAHRPRERAPRGDGAVRTLPSGT